MSEEIEKIIVTFLTNGANKEELKKLTDWLKIKGNVHFFDHYIDINYALNTNINEFDSKGVKEALMKRIKQDKNIFYKLKIRKVMKYVAAALIILGLGYYFQNNVCNTPIETTPIIVNTSIEPGTSKATLTLEDGAQIALKKGDSFQTENANSNGEQIIYKTDKRKTNEIGYNYLTIPRGGQFYVVLSDGTKVWLNSESQLKYPTTFKEGEIRKVELVYGEAYFEVSPSTEHKGSKFQVFNKFQKVEVLGTKFNIKAYKDEANLYTTLVEGKVSVYSETTNQILKPTQQSILNLNNNSMSVITVNVYNEVSWKDGVFIFNGLPLKDIVKTLSRWYNVDFIFINKTAEDK
ncbi:MAG: FecR family protein, partial [Polaribacter sp.]